MQAPAVLSDDVPPVPVPVSTSVVQIDPAGLILYCNSHSQNLLLGADAVGRPLRTVLDEAEKFGRLPLGTTRRVFDDLSLAPSQFELSDGRTVLMNCAKNADGTLIEWWDVADHLATASTGEKDVVTGLPTRAVLMAQITGRLADSKQGGEKSTLLTVQIDRLQSVSELFGQGTVEKLLKKIAGRLVGQVKDVHQVCRLEGDGFFVLLDIETAADEAIAYAQALVDLLTRPYIVSAHMVHVGATIGIAPLSGAVDADEVIGRAGLALLRAHQDDDGYGSVAVYSAALDEQARRRRALEVDLRQALALRELQLVYQPQYEVDGDTLVGFEALVRWTHPVRGAVSPGEFIPVAEDMGIIGQMGEWILRTACREAAGWPGPLTVSVNISPIQLRNPQIVSIVTSALAAAGLQPSRLELEVTEGGLLLNSETIIQIFQRLRALGVRFAMDDFGTGYSSLSYLQKFPFDKIKIDQSFVRNLSSADSAAIVRSVSALGTSLGLTTIAEGVETEEQLRRVKEYGCLQVQGYLTGRPLDVNTARALALATGLKTGEQQ